MNRVTKTLVAGVATVSLVGAPAIAMVGMGTAGAATTVVSPVGKYTATLTLDGTSGTVPLKINGNGTFVFPGGGPKGTWTEAANVVHMTGKLDKLTWGFVVHQSGKNLGSAAKPGTVKVKGMQLGTWYAVRG